MTTEELSLQQGCLRWSNRLLILSVLGIIYLTFFPFEIRFSSPHPFHGSPLYLGESAKTLLDMDFFLNVLLFMPFGFGLSAQVARRGGRRWKSFVLALALGACVSYLVELLQLYIPGRDSGWEDIFSNTMGSVAGFCVFAAFGAGILERASRVADAWDGWMSPRRMAVLLAIYFAACLGVTGLLQMKTRLSNWDPRGMLVVGNDAGGAKPWNGQVSLLQIWNRALPAQTIRSLRGPESGNQAAKSLLGSYDFKSTPPYPDQRQYLPPLAWIPAQPKMVGEGAPELNARSWLRTSIPVADLTREIQKTNQFTVRLICTPASTEDADGRIVSLSQSSDNINFYLRQEGTSLVLWLRDPLSETHSALAWTVRGVFESGKAREILAIYDGADAFLYLDGNRIPQIYRLSPGAALVHQFFFVKTTDLGGYVLVYETLIFLPAGFLAGWKAEKWRAQKFLAFKIVAFGLLLPAVLLEILQMQVSGRRIWPGNIAMSVVFGLVGMLLMNADGSCFKWHRL